MRAPSLPVDELVHRGNRCRGELTALQPDHDGRGGPSGDRLVEDLELIDDEAALPAVREIAERIAGLDLDGLFADGRAPLAGSLSSLGTQLREVHRSVDAAYFRRKQAGRNVQWVQWNGGEESW